MNKVLCIVLVACCLFPALFAQAATDPMLNWDIFVPPSSFINDSDLIVTATVIDTQIKRITEDNKDELVRLSSVRIDEVMKENVSEHLQKDDVIIIETQEGRYVDGMLETPFNVPPRAVPTKKVLLMLKENKAYFNLVSELVTWFEIENGYVKGCGTTEKDFVREIRNIASGSKKEFTLDFPSYYRNSRLEQAGKVAYNNVVPDTTSVSPFHFSVSNSVAQSAQPLKIEFVVNADSCNLDESIVCAIVDTVIARWMRVEDTNIEITRRATTTDSLTEFSNGVSTICFQHLDDVISGDSKYPVPITGSDYFESDIRIDSDPIYDPENLSVLTYIILHEMGHSLCLGDLGTDKYSPENFNDTVMWHNWPNHYYQQLQPGDKQGLVYAIPDPGDTLSFTQMWSHEAYWKLDHDITVPAGDTLQIETCLMMGEDVHIDVFGTLIFSLANDTTSDHDVIELRSDDGGPDWGYIDIKTGGHLIMDFEPGQQMWFKDFDRIIVHGAATITGQIVLDAGVDFEVYGTLNLEDGAILASSYLGPLGGLYVYSGGTLNTNGTADTISGFSDFQIDGTANLRGPFTLNADQDMVITGTLNMLGVESDYTVYGDLTLSNVLNVGWGDFNIQSGSNVTLNSPQIVNCNNININELVELDDYLYLGPGVRVKVYDMLQLNDGATITGISGQAAWETISIENDGEMWVTGSAAIQGANGFAVYIQTGGVLDVDDYLGILDSYGGIYLWTLGDLEKDNDYALGIVNCEYGILVSNATDLFQNIYLENCGEGIRVYGSSSSPLFYYTTIVNQAMIGLNIDNNATAYLERSIIGSATTSSAPYNINLESGARVNCTSYNDFYPRGDGYAIHMQSDSENVLASRCFWGDPNPVWATILSHPAKVYYGDFSLSPYGYGAYFKPTTDTDGDIIEQLATAAEKERNGSWDAAQEIYDGVLSRTDDTSYRRDAVMGLLRVIDHTTKEYSGFRALVEKELNVCSALQRTAYENLLCELYVREGDNEKAIHAFTQLQKKYDGTDAGADILIRLATLYGNNLDDQDKAKTYADKAAAFNPGELSLAIAYNAAGIKYNPREYASMPHDQNQPEELDELSGELVEFIANSPNPFNPATTFNFAITTPGKVRLSVYSITGQKIATLVDEMLDVGTHSARFDGSSLASGMYFYRFESPGFKYNGKMLLVK